MCEVGLIIRGGGNQRKSTLCGSADYFLDATRFWPQQRRKDESRMGGDPLLFLASVVLLFSSCTCFYVPGWSPHTYRVGENVPLFLNKVSSERTHLPYAYSELPGVCKPKDSQMVSLNLGEILRGIYYWTLWTDHRRPDIQV
jgi:hypothetical protein